VPLFGFQLRVFRIRPTGSGPRSSRHPPQLDPPAIAVPATRGGFIYENATPALSVPTFSADPQYGLNIGGWPEHFVDYVALRLAPPGPCMRITNDKELKANAGQGRGQGRGASPKAEEAMNDPPGPSAGAALGKGSAGAHTVPEGCSFGVGRIGRPRARIKQEVLG